MEMEVCTNNGIEHGQILDTIAHSVKLNQDVFVITTTECELVNEVIVTSEEEGHQDTIILNNSLSREVKTPAATPKMPQQSGPRNATHEDAAGLPVATPNFVIPPHLMGRNIDNPAEDMIGSGRKLQKPRLGVRVPYRNLTSQIVTQDEIAQELLERSLKKHPVHDTPEGGDLFFAMKLTQRLANRLTPSATVVSGSTISEMEATGSKPARYQQSSDSTLLPSGYAIVPQSTAIPDNGELLAILEDGDSGWMPEANSAVQKRKTLLAEASKPPPLIEAGPSSENILVHSGPAKLDPLVEREMALRQLMELPIRTKKKKPTNAQEKTGKSSKSKERTKKEANSINKKIAKANNTSVVQGASNQVNRNLTLQVGDTATKQKTAVKRKLLDSDSVFSRQSYTVRKKEQVNKSPKESHLNANSKTDVKRLKQTKIVEAFKRPSVIDKSNGTSLNNCNFDRNKIEVSSPKRKKLASICNSKDITVLSDTNHETGSLIEVQGLSVSTDLCDGKSDDDFPAINARKFATPPRTYSPRKRQPKVEGAGSSREIKVNMVPQTSVSLSSITLPDTSQALAKSASNINIDDCLPTKSSENVVASAFSRDVDPPVSSSAGVVPTKKVTAISEVLSNDSALLDAAAKKRHSRRMGEIDRLLMDEGAINLLYEVEQRDSKRRSGLNCTAESGITTPRKKIRSPLKSVRRQKKDLLLKTRLVKNAVLRLSSVPTPPVAVALRLRRQIDPPKLQLSARQNHDTISQHRKSMDTKESLCSPPPLTPVDPPSPTQTFAFPPRLHLPAEASRIIRRHSSSSTFSSRSASPNLQNRNSVDLLQSPDNAENKPDNHYDCNNQVLSNSKTSADMDKKRPVARKKGVPIFVRKEEVQTYKGKKKKDRIDDLNENAERLLEIKCKELKINKSQEVGKKANLKKSSTASVQNSQRKANSTEKLKMKTQISRNVHKAVQKSKHTKLKKSGQESTLSKQKKKEEREKTLAADKLNNKIPDLPSCLAAVATAFAAEGESLKRLTQLRRGSNDSSHSSSHGSRSSTSTHLPASIRKESKEVPPLSPNASSYSTLIKTLETESQKQKKKEGEETAKQRSSVRQNAGSYHYKDIWLRRYDNLVQIILAPASTKMKNALNIQVLRELREALQQLKRDDSCRVVLLTSAGSVFCQGIDFHCLLHSNADRRKTAAQELALALREFLKTLALFSKPIVAGVHGAAVGLGVTMLPFFDMVIASDKATFYTPYAKLGQVPEGAAILTLPHMLGNAVTSELLFGCRKLTASEALHFGLVTRILWPDRFLEELMPLIRSIANQSAQKISMQKAEIEPPIPALLNPTDSDTIILAIAKFGNMLSVHMILSYISIINLATNIIARQKVHRTSMEATKALLRHNLRTKLDAALESEAHLLVQHWSSMECQSNFRRFLDDEDVGLQRQRLDP